MEQATLVLVFWAWLSGVVVTLGTVFKSRGLMVLGIGLSALVAGTAVWLGAGP